MSNIHSFHIPVMGIGFTIDTPLKVSQYGIDSVISIVDDILIEKMRKAYCEKFDLYYQAITDKTRDFRAKRITAYLNLVNDLAKKQFEALKNSAGECRKYFNMLSDNSALKDKLSDVFLADADTDKAREKIDDSFAMGSIDVNIMTKIDKENYSKEGKLPPEYNDAHAALRGYANSNLHSSMVFSAGMNPRLFTYLERFDDFYPDKNAFIKKKIVLKVSDYKSALVQGKFLAKKGLWVSEYRIESGLNCGGHAFATDGYLMGPILEEFKNKKEELRQSAYKVLHEALIEKSLPVPEQPLPLKITAQGGVGTAEEHQFLLQHYQLDSVGWGTPFLLVPEAVSIDTQTLNKLEAAREDDVYLSNTSPLGVPFYTLKGNTKDEEKTRLDAKGKPGSACPKKFLSNNKEFTEKPICTASRQYQHLKIKQLKKENLSVEAYHKQYQKITEKSCICVGLGTSAMLANNVDTRVEGKGVSVCPGPNMAYFSKSVSLQAMIDHIYGRTCVLARNDRPHMFVKELGIYMNYLSNKTEEAKDAMTPKQNKYLLTFTSNIKEGIQYYKALFNDLTETFKSSKSNILKQLGEYEKMLEDMRLMIENMRLSEVEAG